MSGILFDKIIFGPVISRRLGVSLGINLLPVTRKVCTFNCIYCECGWTTEDDNKEMFPPIADVQVALKNKLEELKNTGQNIDAITFAGNGEPTMHPHFAEIIDNTIALKNNFFPSAKITVLSNSTMLHKENVFRALTQIDNNIMKLDAGTELVFRQINQYHGGKGLNEIIQNLKKFKGELIIQTLFIRGEFKGKIIDNTNHIELTTWLKHIQEINPRLVMIYSFDRETPADHLEKISQDELKKIAEMVENFGISAEVY